ncbi:MAG TPA: hypothetical protein VE269_06765 [Gaiellaceae bacterium]|nr:hypothetical protein [Gaiellaceae bacterium]
MVLPAVALLAVVLLGLLRARRNADEPALLRWRAWQLLLGLVLVLVVLAHPPAPRAGMTMVVPLLLSVLLALLLVVRKRRNAAADGSEF